MDEDKLCTMILAAAIRVHSRLGPGLLVKHDSKTGIKRLING
jgi:hypothetical protein